MTDPVTPRILDEAGARAYLGGEAIGPLSVDVLVGYVDLAIEKADLVEGWRVRRGHMSRQEALFNLAILRSIRARLVAGRSAQ